jgi:hypothetical protein
LVFDGSSALRKKIDSYRPPFHYIGVAVEVSDSDRFIILVLH